MLFLGSRVWVCVSESAQVDWPCVWLQTDGTCCYWSSQCLPSQCMLVLLFICQFVYLLVELAAYFTLFSNSSCLSVCLSVLSVHPCSCVWSVCVCLCVSVCQSLCLFIFVHQCLSVHPSICGCVGLTVLMSCLCFHLSSLLLLGSVYIEILWWSPECYYLSSCACWLTCLFQLSRKNIIVVSSALDLLWGSWSGKY